MGKRSFEQQRLALKCYAINRSPLATIRIIVRAFLPVDQACAPHFYKAPPPF